MRSLNREELLIPIASIKQGIFDYTFTVAHSDLQVGIRGDHLFEAQVVVHVTQMGNDYLVHLIAENDGEFICDRCGESFVRTIHGEVCTLFVHEGVETGWEKADVRVFPANAQFLNVFQDAIDALLLAVPAKVLCSETCAGLCPRCGKNLNEGPCSCSDESIDPRWDVLKNLKLD